MQNTVKTPTAASPFADSPYVILDGISWRAILHRDNQSYLGRSIVFLKTRQTDDPLSLTQDERDGLWTVILPKLIGALQKAFCPDRINYAHLANVVNQIHWHIVPRYEKDPARHFGGETFTDERVGHNYAPAPKKPCLRRS